MATRCAMQQTTFSDAVQRRVICPKPRRIYPTTFLPFRPVEDADPKPVNDIFAALLQKQSDQNPSFFCGSPPTRYDNPVVHDARFGDAVPIEPVPADPAFNGSGSRSGCARVRFGLTPAAVRIEGFDCLDRDRSGSRGIPAVA